MQQWLEFLLAALYQPIWTSAIDSAKSLALALVLFAWLQIWKIAPWELPTGSANDALGNGHLQAFLPVWLLQCYIA